MYEKSLLMYQRTFHAWLYVIQRWIGSWLYGESRVLLDRHHEILRNFFHFFQFCFLLHRIIEEINIVHKTLTSFFFISRVHHKRIIVKLKYIYFILRDLKQEELKFNLKDRLEINFRGAYMPDALQMV